MTLVYEFMSKNSEPLQTGEKTSIVWRGYGKDIAEETKFSINVVYRCIARLEIVGSIRKLRHGARTSPSVYELIKEPVGSEYEQLKERSIMTGRLEMPSQSARVQDSITRLNNRVTDVERRLERLENDRHDIRRSS